MKYIWPLTLTVKVSLLPGLCNLYLGCTIPIVRCSMRLLKARCKRPLKNLGRLMKTFSTHSRHVVCWIVLSAIKLVPCFGGVSNQGLVPDGFNRLRYVLSAIVSLRFVHL